MEQARTLEPQGSDVATNVTGASLHLGDPSRQPPVAAATPDEQGQASDVNSTQRQPYLAQLQHDAMVRSRILEGVTAAPDSAEDGGYDTRHATRRMPPPQLRASRPRIETVRPDEEHTRASPAGILDLLVSQVNEVDSRATASIPSDVPLTPDSSSSPQSVVLVGDVLDMIFKQLTACKRIKTYDVEYAATPFRLAAVCRQWRDVALGPLFWTHLYLPCGPDHRNNNYDLYVQLVLKRSRGQPLHVVLFDCDRDSLTVDALALQAVIAASQRWRAITMTGKSAEWARWRAILHRDTPLLEFVQIFGDADKGRPEWPHKEDLELLPNAPKLRCFELSWVPILCDPFMDWEVITGPRWHGPGPTPLPSLTCLRLLLLEAEAQRIHDVLRSMPNLTELCISLYTLTVEVAHFALSIIPDGGGPYALPKLRYIDLRGAAGLIFHPTCPRVETPALAAATFHPDSIVPLTYFFRTLSNSENVRVLTIIGGIAKVTASALLQLSMLHNVESVELDCRIADTVFDEMSINVEALWPKLHTLHIGGALESDAVTESLLRFIKTKNDIAAEREDISAFQHVCVDEDEWLSGELGSP